MLLAAACCAWPWGQPALAQDPAASREGDARACTPPAPCRLAASDPARHLPAGKGDTDERDTDVRVPGERVPDSVHGQVAEPVPLPRRLADGIHLFEGLPGAPGPDNRARTGNVVVIIGTRGVLVWNSGASDRHGEALVAAITRLTTLPLHAVVLSEPGQDLVFGATAFARRGARILMSASAGATMRQRCGTCLATLRQLLGEGEMAGTQLPDPEPLDAGRFDTLSREIGRRLQGIDLGKAAMAGTISLFDLDSRILLAGPMAMVGRVGEVRDADLDGWRRGLATLQSLAPLRVVPDRGPAGDASDLQVTADYLAALDARTASLLAEGVSLAEAADRADLPTVAQGLQGKDAHRSNVHFRYLELERRQFGDR